MIVKIKLESVLSNDIDTIISWLHSARNVADFLLFFLSWPDVPPTKHALIHRPCPRPQRACHKKGVEK